MRPGRGVDHPPHLVIIIIIIIIIIVIVIGSVALDRTLASSPSYIKGVK
jgi:hypothetical protein